MQLITLEAWLERHYAEPRPSIYTARRWAKRGHITPRPQKHGRSYRVREDAVYRNPEKPATLVERLGGQAA